MAKLFEMTMEGNINGKPKCRILKGRILRGSFTYILFTFIYFILFLHGVHVVERENRKDSNWSHMVVGKGKLAGLIISFRNLMSPKLNSGHEVWR